jgi:diguanylate cyclase (GGDEF)-like protein
MLALAPTLPETTLRGLPADAVPVLTMLEGEEAARTWLLGERSLVVGRDLNCEVPIADAKASRRHARIVWANPNLGGDAPEVWVEDLGSTNGTWVNGVRIERATALREHDKVLVGGTLFGFGLKVDEDQEAMRRLVQRATTDGLTGLFNKEVFDRTLRREFERARRYGRPFSMVVADLDHTTGLNAMHGHRVTDLVLRQVGRVFRDNLRLCDLAARTGGQEFGVLLPETPIEGALSVAERMRLTVQDFPMMVGDAPLNATISLGAIAMDGSFHYPDALVDAAFRALDHAKEQGRNRTAVYAAGG